MVFSLSRCGHALTFWVILFPLATWAAEPVPTPTDPPIDAAPLAITPVATPSNVVTAQPMATDVAAASVKSIQKLYNDGKTQEALAAANQFLEQNPRNGGVAFIKAQALTQLGRVDDAIAVLEALIEKIVIGDGEIDITFSHLPASIEQCKSQQELVPG